MGFFVAVYLFWQCVILMAFSGMLSKLKHKETHVQVIGFVEIALTLIDLEVLHG